MGIGFDNEVADVVRRIRAEADKRGTHASILSHGGTERAVKLLSRYATRLHRSYETACNREQTAREMTAETDTEARVMALCHRLGVSVKFCGDPRGAPIQIPCARENANGWSGDCIVVPYGSQREYDRAYETRRREKVRAAAAEVSS